MNEKLLERKLVKHCRDNGILCYKFVSPGCRGVPDRLLIRNGRVLFLELKSEGQKPTALQEREMSRIRDQRVGAQWADNWDELAELIEFHL